MNLTISPGIRPDYFLFSESLGRFVVTVCPANRKAFELITGSDATLLGKVGGTTLRITAQDIILDVPVSALEEAYKAPFRGY